VVRPESCFLIDAAFIVEQVRKALSGTALLSRYSDYQSEDEMKTAISIIFYLGKDLVL
jgi:hypothetical protein